MNSVTEAGAPSAPAAPLGFRPLLAMAIGAKYEGYPRGGARVPLWTLGATLGGEPAGAHRAGHPERARCWNAHLTARNRWP